MAIEQFDVLPDEENTRLDTYLSEHCTQLSRSAAQGIISAGGVLVNGKLVAKNHRLKAGDLISLKLPEPVCDTALPENIPLQVIFEDDQLLVVNKPRGMVVHPAAGNETATLVNALLYHCSGRLSSINGVIRPGIVHRIDKDTSGLLVVAKTDLAHTFLSEQFAAHSIDRVYMAVVHGRPKQATGTINAPIGRNPNDRKKMCITQKNARNAITHYQIIEEFQGYTLVQVTLETGRTHQIRVHMASLGHPVAGDGVYGPKKGLDLNGQCLHAKVLGFVHPTTGERLRFETELPPYFLALLKNLRRI